METFKKCKVENCENKYFTKEYCRKHYMQIYRHGEILKRTMFDPNKIIDCGDYYEICLYKGRNEQTEIDRTKIDKEDLKKVKNYKWHLNNGGYAITRINNKNIPLHHLIFGYPPTRYMVDHRDTNKLNNRKYNFRFVTDSQNKMNRKVKGYSWNKARNKWRTQIYINNKSIHLGYFTNEQDAVKARKEAERKYFGEFAYKNNNNILDDSSTKVTN